MKYAVVFGAASGARSITNVPAEVSTTACFGACADCARARLKPDTTYANTTTYAKSRMPRASTFFISNPYSRVPNPSRVCLDDSRRVPDVVHARHERDDERCPDEQIDDAGM